MANKGTFRLTFIAAAALGLGLVAYGCGHSGSTTPNPLVGSTTPAPPVAQTSKVVFTYNVLSKDSYAKAIPIPAHIDKVTYAFSGTNQAKEPFTKTDPAYTYYFKHKDKAYQQKVVIQDVDTNSDKVTAAYYDDKDQLVAIGVNDLEWDKANSTSEVGSPDLQSLDQQATATLSADNYIISKNGQIYFTFEVTTNPGSEPIDMTDLAIFSGLDEKVFSHPENAVAGVYTGIAYGQANKVSATLGQIKADLGQTVYVTDQTPAKIALVPQPIDGKEIINHETPDGRRMNMLFADDGVKYNTFGQKVVSYKTSSGDVDNFPVNEVPFKVLITEYSSTSGQGLSPQVPIDITFDGKTSVEANLDMENYASPSAYDVNKMAIKDRSKIVVEELNPNWNNYKVVAKYDDGSKDGITETTKIYVEGAKANLVFWNNKTNQKLEKIFKTGGSVQTYDELRLVGQIEVFGNCVYTDIPEDMIPVGQYPDVVTPPHFINTGEVADSKYVAQWRQVPKHSGTNTYAITIQYLLEHPWPDNVKLDLQRPEGTTYPYFGGVYVYKY